jgi:hypothetical protein
MARGRRLRKSAGGELEMKKEMVLRQMMLIFCQMLLCQTRQFFCQMLLC